MSNFLHHNNAYTSSNRMPLFLTATFSNYIQENKLYPPAVITDQSNTKYLSNISKREAETFSSMEIDTHEQIENIDFLLIKTYEKIIQNSTPVDNEIYKIFSENILDLF
ncbi:hypothetical protein [Commensalibacter melissae]|uniref:hypothetical protein n=1 Tax=Commensalibacter melissae TaxID=2070537 RepID=UPI0012D87A99|nr:hypothetical protein [Commensalibacter melissae]MUH04041.1 hypothetical protein [Commensalibacter melissae]